jgi:hypothetical protein
MIDEEDQKLLEEFAARHAGQSADELARLALEELPADLLAWQGALDMARVAVESLPEGVVLTKEEVQLIAEGLTDILCEAVKSRNYGNFHSSMAVRAHHE